MATNKPQDEFVKTALRLPKELHANLHQAAKANSRSYNSEIIARLEDTFSRQDVLTELDIKDRLLSIIHTQTSLEALEDKRRKLLNDPSGDTAELEDIEFQIEFLENLMQELKHNLKYKSSLNTLVKVGSEHENSAITELPSTPGKQRTRKAEK